jgi:hypothetical protein
MRLNTDAECDYTKHLISRFEQTLESLSNAPEPSDENDAWVLKIQAAQVSSQIEDLRAQIAEYEALKSGQRRRFEFHSVEGLFTVLIKARIAAGISRAELAEALGIEEVQLRRYEDKEYQTAPLGVIFDVAYLLGVNIEGSVTLGDSTRFAEAKRIDAEVGIAPAPELVATE